MKVGHRAKVWPSGEDCARRTTSTSGARCQGKDATSMTSSVFPNSFMMSVTVTTVQVSRKFREVRTTCSDHTAAVVVELSKVSQKNRATGRQWYREGGGTSQQNVCRRDRIYRKSPALRIARHSFFFFLIIENII